MNDFQAPFPTVRLEYKLTNVMLSSFDTSGQAGAGTETFSFGYEKVKIEY